MSKRKGGPWWAFVISLLIVSSAVDLQAAPVRSTTYGPPELHAPYAPGEVLVKFKGVRPLPSTGPLVGTEMRASLPLQAQAALSQIQGTVKKVFPRIAAFQVQIPHTLSVGQAIEALYRSGAVVYAEPNYLVQVDAIPNDPRFGEQWNLHNTGQSGGTVDADIDAPEAWDVQTSATKTIVAVIDSGVEYSHEDLSLNMWKNPNEIPGNGIDDDGNGYVDDVYGIDAQNNDADPSDDNGHGTHCAGIIGAVGNNGKGISGIAWAAKIMALKFTDSHGSGSTSGAIECIEYALDIKQRCNYPRMILSNSWGIRFGSQALYSAIGKALDAGVLFVASAGNNGWNTDITPEYPADYDLPNIISVGASDRYDKYASFSNFGSSSVDLFAPGVEILSTWIANYYEEAAGTSMACPHVAGACALLWHRRSSYDWKIIKGLILNGAEDGKAAPAFTQKCVTEGRLNLNRSLNPSRVDDPAIFSITPNETGAATAITIKGINFGTSGTLSFRDVDFDAASIVSWTNVQIVATVPRNLPLGYGRLIVKTAGGISRGAALRISVEHLVGHTILARGWAAAAQVNNFVWICGGSSNWGMTGLVERYNLSTGRSVMDSSWMMPIPVTNAGAAAIGIKVYVVGGCDGETGEVYDSLQVLDTSTNTWTLGPPLPKKLMQPTVVAYKGNLYVFGGIDETYTVVNTAYRYSPSAGNWKAKASLPTKTAYAAGARVGISKIWLMGGFSSPYFGYEQKVVQEYDVATNSWATQLDMVKARGGAGGMSYGTTVLCLHGSGSGSYGMKDIEWFGPAGWSNTILGAEGLFTPGIGRDLNRVYSLGGFTGQGYSNNVWCFSSP